MFNGHCSTGCGKIFPSFADQYPIAIVCGYVLLDWFKQQAKRPGWVNMEVERFVNIIGVMSNAGELLTGSFVEFENRLK